MRFERERIGESIREGKGNPSFATKGRDDFQTHPKRNKYPFRFVNKQQKKKSTILLKECTYELLMTLNNIIIWTQSNLFSTPTEII